MAVSIRVFQQSGLPTQWTSLGVGQARLLPGDCRSGKPKSSRTMLWISPSTAATFQNTPFIAIFPSFFTRQPPSCSSRGTADAHSPRLGAFAFSNHCHSSSCLWKTRFVAPAPHRKCWEMLGRLIPNPRDWHSSLRKNHWIVVAEHQTRLGRCAPREGQGVDGKFPSNLGFRENDARKIGVSSFSSVKEP